MDAINHDTILKQLDAEQLASQLRDLDRNRRALMILLRAARAQQKPSAQTHTPSAAESREVEHA